MRTPSQHGAVQGVEGVVSIPTTAGGTLLLSGSAKYNRRRVLLKNMDGANAVTIARKQPVTANSGYVLAAGEARWFRVTQTLYGLAANAAVNVSYFTEDDD